MVTSLHRSFHFIDVVIKVLSLYSIHFVLPFEPTFLLLAWSIPQLVYLSMLFIPQMICSAGGPGQVKNLWHAQMNQFSLNGASNQIHLMALAVVNTMVPLLGGYFPENYGMNFFLFFMIIVMLTREEGKKLSQVFILFTTKAMRALIEESCLKDCIVQGSVPSSWLLEWSQNQAVTIIITNVCRFGLVRTSILLVWNRITKHQRTLSSQWTSRTNITTQIHQKHSTRT